MRTPLIVTSLLGMMAGTVIAGDGIRVPAEWEPHESTWMQWPKGIESSYRPNFAGIIDALQAYEPINLIVANASQRTQAQSYLTNRGVPLDNITWHIMPYNWAWMRDNGPVWVDVDGTTTLQDWGFDGWGGEVNQYAADDAVPCQVADIVSAPCDVYDLINERGNLEFNGVDTVITTWPVWEDRIPGATQPEIETALEDAFGVEHVVWLLTAPASDVFTGGHIDGIARFIDADTVVVSRYVDQSDPDAPAYEEAAQILADAGFEVLRLDIPGHVTYSGVPMAANYVNWLVANGVVVMSGFDHAEWDEAARQTVETYFPDRDVIITETLELWYWGGGVHCVTNDQPLIVPAAPCAADLNGDGAVGPADLAGLLAAWGSDPGGAPDFNDDGVVGPADLAFLLESWGDC